MNVDLKAKPYELTDEQVQKLELIIGAMSIEEKCGQLFCDVQNNGDLSITLDRIKSKHVGAVMACTGKLGEVKAHIEQMQANARLPLLIAANLESGGNGAFEEGTYFGKQMQIAATKDTNNAKILGGICGSEGKLAGVNWAFAPVADIDCNFRNPITSVRTYGSDPMLVAEMVSQYITAVQAWDVASSVKHFPGDGVDERDQHFAMSVNSLSCEEWDKTYGEVYQRAIESGALTVMAGHIAMPAYEEYFSGEAIYRPATQSENIITGLLKGKLHFNGMVTTDATQMIGFCSGLPRQEALIQSINSGCDMLLFSVDFEEDYQWVLEACKNGRIKPERLADAMRRILGVKMKLGLFAEKNSEEKPEDALDLPYHQSLAAACADASVTLVKDRLKLIPMDVEKYPRVLLEILGDSPTNRQVEAWFKQAMEQKGFKVYTYSLDELLACRDSVTSFKEKYDLVLYVGNIDDTVGGPAARIRWYHQLGWGNHIPWFAQEVPTVCVSLGSPYLLLDVPMFSTYINGYSNSEFVVRAVVEKLVGESSFKGKSPVDPFCGYEDTKL